MTTDPIWLFTMPELRKAVRTLAEFVVDERTEPTPEVVDALNIYNSACQQVNDRLVECNRLLRLGQRSEALRQVQIEPDVFDMHKELQFANRGWLPEKCKNFDLSTPPRLDMSAAKSLNEAYSLENHLQLLLREHRILALSRAPIRSRIVVLRLIQKESKREAFWQDDLAAYEQKRIDEIRKQMAGSHANEDWDAIQDLHKESTTPSIWRTPFPLDLVDQIRQARKRLMHKAANEGLRPLTDQLALAIDDDQIDRVKNLIGRAEALKQKYELPDGGSLMAPFDGARQWIRDRTKNQKKWQQFLQAVDTLRFALNDGLGWAYVQKLHLGVLQYGWPLPDDVAYKLRQRAKSRQGLWLFGGISLLVSVAMMIAIVVFRNKF